MNKNNVTTKSKDELEFVIAENTQVLGFYSYVMCTNAPYFMFQVVTFDTEEEMQAFLETPTTAHIFLPGYRVALMFSHSLAEPVCDPYNMNPYIEYFKDIMTKAAAWFYQYRHLGENDTKYSQFKIDNHEPDTE